MEKMKLPNKEQKELLKKQDYEVLEQFGVVHYLKNRESIAYLLWDTQNGEFYVQVKSIELCLESNVTNYSTLLKPFLDLVLKLNKLGDKN